MYINVVFSFFKIIIEALDISISLFLFLKNTFQYVTLNTEKFIYY